MKIKATSNIAAVQRLLTSHPLVDPQSEAHTGSALSFDQDGWKRRIFIGDATVQTAGLIETMDNNPMVCADEVGVPGPAATLALIALEPLVHAGLLLEEPVVQIAGTVNEDIEPFLRKIGWEKGAVMSFGNEDLGSAVALNAIALVSGECSQEDLLQLYRECFSRSIYVRENTTDPWDVSLVTGKPFACYRVTVGEPDRTRLVTVRVVADRDGKAGAAQVVHAMNVMCGFEECAGIPS